MSDRAALVLLVGPPGAGKSTWAAGRFPRHDVFSLDVFRRMLTGDVADQSATEEAVRMLNLVVAYRMTAGLLAVVDACNTRPEHREPLIAEARESGVPVLAVVMATPPAVCRARNATRGDMPAPYPGANTTPVPDEVVVQLAREAREYPPRVGEVDAILTIGPGGNSIEWDGSEDLLMIAEPWLADALDAPTRPRFVADPR